METFLLRHLGFRRRTIHLSLLFRRGDIVPEEKACRYHVKRGPGLGKRNY